ncbi:MAG: hypothetical protein AB1629_04920 [Candidatus Omnitrophota bacterium]
MKGRVFFANFLRTFKKKDVAGQSVMEYFIILALVVAVTALGVSTFLSKNRESGETVFNKAVERITAEFTSGRLKGCECVKYTKEDGCIRSGCFSSSRRVCVVDRETGERTCTEEPGPEVCYSAPGWVDTYISISEGSWISPGATLTFTSAQWQEITGVALSPGTYSFKFLPEGNIASCEFLWCPGHKACRRGGLVPGSPGDYSFYSFYVTIT